MITVFEAGAPWDMFSAIVLERSVSGAELPYCCFEALLRCTKGLLGRDRESVKGSGRVIFCLFRFFCLLLVWYKDGYRY